MARTESAGRQRPQPLFHLNDATGTVTLPCGDRLSQDFILRIAARIVESRRRRPKGGAMPGAGRPVKLVICEKCGAEGGTAKMRGHKC